MALLYTGLDSEGAAEVVAALEQIGSEYEIRGSAIYVDQNERDSIRMTLAGQSLPSDGVDGYELLDELAGFGTTSQMFDATYWRAKEGELARTILGSPNIRAARVHLAVASKKPFQAAVPNTASVTLTLNRETLGADSARAIRYLVASAVSGLVPENVTIIDASNGAILVVGDTGDTNAAGNQSQISERLRLGVERLLEARVGAGKAVVELFVDINTESETLVERSFDPDSRVAISTETEESADNATGNNAGNVTVASNLPDGSAQTGSQSTTNNTSTKERVNYEVSESTHEILRAPGQIKRISAAVLIDGIATLDDVGNRSWTERAPEELEVFANLVKSAIGFDEARGDNVTVTSMEFPVIGEAGTLAESSTWDLLAVNVIKLVQLTVLGLVSLVVGLFVLRPILTAQLPQTLQIAAPAANEPVGNVAGTQLRELPALTSEARVDGTVALRGFVADRAKDSSKVLKGWIESSEGGSNAGKVTP